MKFTKYVLLLLAATFVFASTSNAQGFEGKITMQLTMPQMSADPMPMTMEIKGQKSVTSMVNPMAGEIKIYTDRAAMKSIVVQGGKMGFETDLNKTASTNDTSTATVTPTDQKKTINGYACTLYKISMHDGIMNMWMTADFPKEITAALGSSFSDNMRGMRGAHGAMSAVGELLAKGLAPVETDVEHDGQIMATMQFVKYEKTTIPDSDLTVPPGVDIKPMPSMPAR